jgi:hypothetical protein
MMNPFSVFRRVPDVSSATKLGTTTLQKKAELYDVPFGTSTRLWIPSADHKIEIRHFSVSIFCLILSVRSSRDAVQAESRGEYKKNQDSSSVIILLQFAPCLSSSALRISLESDTLTVFWLDDRMCGTQRRWLFSSQECREESASTPLSQS